MEKKTTWRGCVAEPSTIEGRVEFGLLRRLCLVAHDGEEHGHDDDAVEDVEGHEVLAEGRVNVEVAVADGGDLNGIFRRNRLRGVGGVQMDQASKHVGQNLTKTCQNFMNFQNFPQNS